MVRRTEVGRSSRPGVVAVVVVVVVGEAMLR